MITDNSKRICLACQPRTGSSMMMRVLEMGGVKVNYDKSLNTKERHDKLGNPYGFYEQRKPFGNCKLMNHKSLKEARGAKIIYITRNTDQAIKSWNNVGLKNTEKFIRNRTLIREELQNHDYLVIRYEDMHSNPRKQCERIKKFLGEFDVDKAVGAVDNTLLVKR